MTLLVHCDAVDHKNPPVRLVQLLFVSVYSQGPVFLEPLHGDERAAMRVCPAI